MQLKFLRASARSEAWFLGGALFFAALAAGPLLADPGFLSTRGGGDSPFLLLRLHQLVTALQTGQFPVRWMPDAAYGYGFPFFSYYAALPYYLAALFRLLGCSWVLSLKLTQLGALLGAAAGMYAWTRAAGLSRSQALLAAAAYTFAPFHLVNLYVRGDSLSELWAMTWYPVALWQAQQVVTRPGRPSVTGLAVVTALLILTHNISALNFMPFLLVYLTWGALRSRARWPVAAAAALALAFGLGLAAFFWMPALGETSAVQIGGVSSSYFFYGNHFRSWDLVQPTVFFNFEPTTDRPTPFSMGLVQTLALLGGMVGLAWRRRWTWNEVYALGGLGLATLMLLPVSAGLWEHLPLLKLAQFPWRFLSIQAVFAAALTAQLAPPDAPATERLGTRNLGLVVALVGLPLFTLGSLHPDFIPISDSDVTPERLQLYEAFTANIGSTIGYEYLPRAVQPRPYTGAAVMGRAPAITVLAGAATGAQQWQRGAREQWEVTVTSASATLALPIYYWPGWQADLDGHAIPVRAADSLGWLTIEVPAGRHVLTAWLGSTPLRAAAGWLSGFLWLTAGWLGWQRRPRRVSWKRWGVALLALVGAHAVLTGIHPTDPAAAPLSMDFAQLAYPHHAPVQFPGGTRLLTVQYAADHLEPGQTLAIHLEWQGTGDAALALTPLANLLLPANQSWPLGTVSAAPIVDSRFKLPEDLPPGVYAVTLTHTSGPALTSAGRPRGLVYLAPIWIESAAAATPVPPADQPALLGLQLTPPNHLVLHWQAPALMSRNTPLALRLRDLNGNEWAALDIQPGGGFYPTFLWRPGELIADRYDLPLPDGTPPGGYPLTVSLYDPLTDQPVLETTQWITLTTLSPVGGHTARYPLLPGLALEKVDWPAEVTQGDAPELAAHWVVGAPVTRPYRAQWTLEAGGTVLPQTLDLAAGSDPLTWSSPAYVLGRVRWPVAQDTPPGDYALAVQLVDGTQLVGSKQVVTTVHVRGRPRLFTVPPLQTSVGASFGQVLTLWGYDAALTPEAVQLTLVWGALDTPDRDFKYFVHLYNRADENVPVQADAMPHAFTYPTGLWVKGEVVTDTVTLALAGVPPGEYGLAVGWYDPADPAHRLPALNAAGEPLEADRVILPLTVIRP